jgi:hypothetical protein
MRAAMRPMGIGTRWIDVIRKLLSAKPLAPEERAIKIAKVKFVVTLETPMTKKEQVLESGLARTLGNLSRPAPCLIDSYIGLRDVSLHDARRPDNGED